MVCTNFAPFCHLWDCLYWENQCLHVALRYFVYFTFEPLIPSSVWYLLQVEVTHKCWPQSELLKYMTRGINMQILWLAEPISVCNLWEVWNSSSYLLCGLLFKPESHVAQCTHDVWQEEKVWSEDIWLSLVLWWVLVALVSALFCCYRIKLPFEVGLRYRFFLCCFLWYSFGLSLFLNIFWRERNRKHY